MYSIKEDFYLDFSFRKVDIFGIPFDIYILNSVYLYWNFKEVEKLEDFVKILLSLHSKEFDQATERISNIFSYYSKLKKERYFEKYIS